MITPTRGVLDKGGAVKDGPQFLPIDEDLVPLQKKLTHPFLQLLVFICFDKFITPQAEVNPGLKILHSR
jgi:hypothetical protein